MVINWPAVSAVISLVALVCSGAMLLFGFLVSNKILNNDFVHVQASLDRIEEEMRSEKAATEAFRVSILQRVARIEGKFEK